MRHDLEYSAAVRAGMTAGTTAPAGCALLAEGFATGRHMLATVIALQHYPGPAPEGPDFDSFRAGVADGVNGSRFFGEGWSSAPYTRGYHVGAEVPAVVFL